jgi:hypothetical protein
MQRTFIVVNLQGIPRRENVIDGREFTGQYQWTMVG